MTRYRAKPFDESPLIGFLTGCFHEDWRLDHQNEEAVIDAFATVTSAAERGGVIADIDEVLAEWDGDEELRDMIGRHLVGCNGNGLPAQEWLRRLRQRLVDPR